MAWKELWDEKEQTRPPTARTRSQPNPQHQSGKQPPAIQKGGKGKNKGSSTRSWKSENFPANYDQVTPAVQTSEPLDWWNEEAELSSVCLHSENIDFNLAAFDDDELDEETADLLDLHFVSIIHQSERIQLFSLHPSAMSGKKKSPFQMSI